MSPRRLAWSVWALCVALTLVGLGFLLLNGGNFLTFPTVGAAIATREPANAIGWLFLGAGVGAAVEDSMLGYATYALVVEPGSLAGGRIAALLADAVWLPALGAASLLLFVLFPTGHPPSVRWRWLVWLVGIDLALYAVATLVNPEPLYFYPGFDNPWGIPGTGEFFQAVTDITSPVLFATLLLGLLALAVRFRRATGTERLQLKWLVWSAAVWAGATPLLIWIGAQGDGRVAGVLVGDLLFSLLIVFIPVAVGTSILRHRLYDIDVVINQTLVYGSLTLALVGSYVGLVLLLQLVLNPLTGESDLAVAGSTLVVAALFRPLRARIQSGVDQRFYRSRYDAARTLEGFSGRLREELDLEALGADLRTVVRDTVQPTQVSPWLREEATR